MKKYEGSILLLICSLIWGSTFVSQTKAMELIGPFFYNSIRFLIGFLILIPLAIFSVSRYTQSDKKAYVVKSIKVGLLIGIPEAIGSTLQQAALVGTTASKAGFLTALYIVFVPILGIFFSRKADKNVIFAVCLAMCGFYFLCINGSLSVNFYDLLLVGCAVAFSLQILFIDAFATDCDSILVSQFQFLLTSAMNFVLFIFSKEELVYLSFTKSIWMILYAGILSCGVAYTLQIVGQKKCEPVLATLIMSLESVFASIFGVILMHDALSPSEVTGCIMIFAAVLLAQFQFKDLKKLFYDKIKK